MSETIQAVNVGSKYVLDATSLARIRDVLGKGGLVVHPTDTVYGLGADPFQGSAVERLHQVKGRPRTSVVSIAVTDVESLFRYGAKTPLAEAFCAKNLPGPYTVVLTATPEAPPAVVSRDRKIGQRVPRHPIPRLLAKAFGPITSTSANRHGQPSPTSCEEARGQLGDAVDLYIDGGPTPLGAESTVVDLSGRQPKILRQGVAPQLG